MREELDGAAKALLGPSRVAVQIGVLSVVPAARVVLDRLDLAVRFGLDMFVEDIVFWKLPQDTLLPFVFVLFATNLAQQHAAQLLAPINVLGVVLFDEPIKVALALFVGLLVELLFGGPISDGLVFLIDDALAVGFGCEDGPKLRHGLLSHGRQADRQTGKQTPGRWVECRVRREE